MAVKKTTVKTEAAKTAAKEEAAVKTAAVKAEAPAAAAPVKAAAAVKEAAPAKKAAEKKAPAKKAAKAETNVEVFVEFNNEQVALSEIIENVKTDNVKAAKDIKIYVKPEDNAAYYVADGRAGKVKVYFC